MLRRIAGYDTGLWASTLAILSVSVFLLLTAISEYGEPTQAYGYRQLAYAVVGIGIAIGAARIDLSAIERRWPFVYVGMVVSICTVFVIGTTIRGARSWIELGPVNLQPSEFGKVLLMLALGGFAVSRIRDMHRWSMLALTLGLAAVPATLVFIQPDFGTAQVYAVIGFTIVFFAGARWLHLAAVGGVVLLLAVLAIGILPALGVQVLREHQMQRLTGFLHPEQDMQGSGYHAVQSKIAIGSGGAWGQTAGEATQVKDAFLPEPHTDFIFATLCERYGFAGGAFVLGLFALLISRCLRGVAVSPTIFGRLVCGSVAAMFMWQLLVNVGMSIGVMPITGVPLPLFSYGGSAMFANLAAIGLVAGVLRSSEAAGARYARRAPAAEVAGLLALQPNSHAREGRMQRRSRVRR